MSASIAEPEPVSRKRTLDDFVKHEPAEPQVLQALPPMKHPRDSGSDKENMFFSPKVPSSTPAQGSPGLTVSGSSPINADSPCPNPTPDRSQANALSPTRHSNSATPLPQSSATQSSDQPPAKKRKRLTEDEKKAKADADEAKKQEKEAQKAAKAAEQAKLEEEKRRKNEEREKKRREKEDAEKAKADEKAAKAAERAEKQAEKRQRAEEKEQKKREKEEEDAKKNRSQMRLKMFFTKSTPKKEPAIKTEDLELASSATSGADAQGQSKELTWFQKEFKPFFVKSHVTLATNKHYWNEETTEAKTQILDEFMTGKRTHAPQAFDPTEVLQLPFEPRPRGRVCPSVRDIMAKYSGSSTNPVDLTTRNSQILDARKALKAVPLKCLKFREDVRPPYIGTVSTLPPGITNLKKIARNSLSRKVLPLDYDYDSEAEWQDDDGEDLENDEDDDEDIDEDEEMEDFLDDSEDAGVARPLFSGGIEPKSYGPCWENYKRLAPEPHMYKYRMEFCLESLPHHHSIDPFSTEYWAPPSKGTASTAIGNETLTPASAKPSGAPSSTSSVATTHTKPMAPPPAPGDAFQALTGGTTGKKAMHGLPPDLLEKLKDLVRQNPKLSKTGVIELFKSQNSCPRAQIVVSFDAITEKVNSKRRRVKGDE